MPRTLGRSPTIPELAEHLDVSTDDIVDATEAVQAYSTTSLDAPIGGEGKAPVESIGAEDPSLELLEEWSSLAPAVAELSRAYVAHLASPEFAAVVRAKGMEPA